MNICFDKQTKETSCYRHYRQNLIAAGVISCFFRNHLYHNLTNLLYKLSIQFLTLVNTIVTDYG